MVLKISDNSGEDGDDTEPTNPPNPEVGKMQLFFIFIFI